MMTGAQKLTEFVNESPVSFVTIENIAERLTGEGYEEHIPGEGKLLRGGKYFCRMDSVLAAFRVPECDWDAFVVAGSHCDSPCFKLREEPELCGQYVRLNCERYGSAINMTWFDRPLGIAGMVLIRSGKGIRKKAVNLSRPMAVIPRVSLHLDRSVNNKYEPDYAKDFIALFSDAGNKGSYKKAIAQAAGCSPDDIISSDLFLYNLQKAEVWGPEGEFISGPRMDDLACVYASLEAFLASGTDSGRMPVFCVYDNEEIGSHTKNGAASFFLRDLLLEAQELFYPEKSFSGFLKNSFILSCDNAHAVQPDNPGLSDYSEAPLLNKGPVLKHSPHYATSSVSGALFKEICRRAGIPFQMYSNRPDQPGGSTIGNILSQGLYADTVDIGIAQLAMHSSYETIGAKDVDAMISALKAAYEIRITIE